eukprot:TRINITY_DN68185_c2_g1_i1.p1 TRINITY_DN68185_c2_g1~~TRINITY_DN68185_c2_g1_i1.p1  ORF type:complete len:172 (+),score=8.27 TRINITY_DN68185_c2_g1_i1:510-1025(+)
MKNTQICWTGFVVPVNQVGEEAFEHIFLTTQKNKKWDMLLHMGLENKAKGLKLEVAAANILARPNKTAPEYPIHKGGPAILPTSVNLEDISLDNLPLPFKDLWSRDAGTYFCNELYYRSLYNVREMKLRTPRGALLPSLFTHLPEPKTVPIPMVQRIIEAICDAVIASERV